MGDPEYEAEYRVRRARRWFVAVTGAALCGVLAAGAWVYAQVPSAVALTAQPAGVGALPETLNDRAALATDRLAEASGRTLDSLAQAAASPAPANPITSDAPVVAGTEAGDSDFATTFDELTAAEQAAAEQLAMSEEEVAAAEEERDKAAKDLRDEESAAAREIDAAIDAAIAAAQAQTAYVPLTSDFYFGDPGGAVADPVSTTTKDVLELVRKHFPASEVGNAMAVSRCESGHANRVSEANANGTHDYGIFQINDGGTLQAGLRRIGVEFSDIDDARAKALDPAINVRIARAIWDSRGWQPWVCSAKVQVVAGLYQRAPGPMYGKYDEYGRAL